MNHRASRNLAGGTPALAGFMVGAQFKKGTGNYKAEFNPFLISRGGCHSLRLWFLSAE